MFAGKTILGTNHVDPELATNDISDVNGHGTFVASILGGNSDKMVGVAPEATIRMYRILESNKGTAASGAIYRALLQAEADNVDLLSISYGTPMSSYKSGRVAEQLKKTCCQNTCPCFCWQ